MMNKAVFVDKYHRRAAGLAESLQARRTVYFSDIALPYPLPVRYPVNPSRVKLHKSMIIVDMTHPQSTRNDNLFLADKRDEVHFVSNKKRLLPWNH
jgi:hypothetical protein